MSYSVAVFPGSFDPFTRGHYDIATRALRIFDRIIIAVLANVNKAQLFTPEERAVLIRAELKRFGKRVEVKSFQGLLVDFARAQKARIIVRGLRAISDYDYEAQMALMNRKLDSKIETLYLMTSEENSYVSSSLAKNVAFYGGSVKHLVSPRIEKALVKALQKKAAKSS